MANPLVKMEYYFELKKPYLWSKRMPGAGELPFSVFLGIGIRPISKKKWQIPGDVLGEGGIVTQRIEPCITTDASDWT